MNTDDDFEKGMIGYLDSTKNDEIPKGGDFMPTKSATLYVDYDQWGLGNVTDIATNAETTEALGGFPVSIEVQWNEERESYFLPKSGTIFRSGQWGFCLLVSAVAKETNMSLASALMCLCFVFRAKGIPFPSVVGSPLEWVISKSHKWEKDVLKILTASQVISRTESTQ
jgi:hypothetical protein